MLSTCTIGGCGELLDSNSKRPVKCVFLNNRAYQGRPSIVDINSNEALSYPVTVSVNMVVWWKWCNVSVIKNIILKVYSLISGENKTRYLGQYESCECKWWLNESVCNSLQEWNQDESWCKCEKLDDCGSCKNNYMENPRTSNFECNKAWRIDNNLENCS